MNIDILIGLSLYHAGLSLVLATAICKDLQDPTARTIAWLVTFIFWPIIVGHAYVSGKQESKDQGV